MNAMIISIQYEIFFNITNNITIGTYILLWYNLFLNANINSIENMIYMYRPVYIILVYITLILIKVI